MFRTIAHPTEPRLTEFFALCDNRSCGVEVRSPVPPVETQEDTNRAKNAFIVACVKDGWMINLEAQLCPVHTQALKDAAMLNRHGLGGGQARVVRPSPSDLVQLGAGKGGWKQ